MRFIVSQSTCAQCSVCSTLKLNDDDDDEVDVDDDYIERNNRRAAHMYLPSNFQVESGALDFGHYFCSVQLCFRSFCM